MKGFRTALVCALCVFALPACTQEKHHDAQGYIEGRYVYLSSDFPGRLIKRPIRRGDTVTKNQLLYQLDQEPQLSQLAQAKSDVQSAEQTLNNLKHAKRSTVIRIFVSQQKQAKARLVFAQQTLQRNQKLYQKKAIGKAALDRALSDYRAALQRYQELTAQVDESKLGARKHLIYSQEARVSAAKARVKGLTWQLSQKTMHAPLDAFVFDTFFRVGEFVSAGKPVLSLLAPRYVKLLFFVPEPELSQLKKGQMVYFSCDGCEGKTSATIYYISPQAEYTPPVIFSKDSRAKLVYRVEARIDPDKVATFHPGQPVDVHYAS